MAQYEIISDRQERVLRYLDAHHIPFTTYNQTLRTAYGLHVKTGRFGADMQVDFINSGPVTILLDTDELK